MGCNSKSKKQAEGQMISNQTTQKPESKNQKIMNKISIHEKQGMKSGENNTLRYMSVCGLQTLGACD